MAIASCAFAAVSLLGPPAKTPTAEVLLARMRSAYSKVKTVRLVIEPNDPLYTIGSPLTVTMQRPDYFRIDVKLKDGQNMRIVSDGKFVVSTDFTGSPVKQPMDERNQWGNMPVNLEVICFLRESRELSTKPGGNMAASKLSVQEKSTVYVLKEVTTNPPLNIFYEVDKKSFLIMRTTRFNGNQTRPNSTYKVTSLELNPKLPVNFFDLPSH